MNKHENFKKRLIYRSSYRGKKEMDILLSSFVKFYINKFSKKDLDELDKLLDYEDEVILNFYQNNVTNEFFKESKVSKLLKNFKI